MSLTGRTFIQPFEHMFPEIIPNPPSNNWPKSTFFAFFEGLVSKTLLELSSEHFWINLERVNPQSTRHGAVETHVGPFCGKRVKRSIVNEKRPAKRAHKSIKTINKCVRKTNHFWRPFLATLGGLVMGLEFVGFGGWGPFCWKKLVCLMFCSKLEFWFDFKRFLGPIAPIWGRIWGWCLGTFGKKIGEMFPQAFGTKVTDQN